MNTLIPIIALILQSSVLEDCLCIEQAIRNLSKTDAMKSNLVIKVPLNYSSTKKDVRFLSIVEAKKEINAKIRQVFIEEFKRAASDVYREIAIKEDIVKKAIEEALFEEAIKEASKEFNWETIQTIEGEKQ